MGLFYRKKNEGCWPFYHRRLLFPQKNLLKIFIFIQLNIKVMRTMKVVGPSFVGGVFPKKYLLKISIMRQLNKHKSQKKKKKKMKVVGRFFIEGCQVTNLPYNGSIRNVWVSNQQSFELSRSYLESFVFDQFL